MTGKMIIRMLVFLVAVLFVAVGCAGQEPGVAESTPIIEPTVAPATDPPLPTARPATATPLSPSPSPAPTLDDLATAWETAYNTGEQDTLLAMYAPDIVWEENGSPPREGKEALAEQLAFEAALNSQIALADCQADAQTVTCTGVAHNDWLAAAAQDPLSYDALVFTFTGDKITNEQRLVSPASEQMVANLCATITPWISARHPRSIDKVITADGQLVIDPSRAADLVEFTTERYATTLIENADDLYGGWRLYHSDGIHGVAIEFSENGQGRVVSDPSKLAVPPDPEDPSSGYLIEYWFDGPVLNIKQVTEGSLFNGPWCDVADDTLGQYLAEVTGPDEISFLVVKDDCRVRRPYMTGYPWLRLDS